MSDPETYLYTIQLRVVVKGPDADWDLVAQRLAERVDGLRIVGNYRVEHSDVDQAGLEDDLSEAGKR